LAETVSLNRLQTKKLITLSEKRPDDLQEMMPPNLSGNLWTFRLLSNRTETIWNWLAREVMNA
jgi:hypothetical protein